MDCEVRLMKLNSRAICLVLCVLLGGFCLGVLGCGDDDATESPTCACQEDTCPDERCNVRVYLNASCVGQLASARVIVNGVDEGEVTIVGINQGDDDENAQAMLDEIGVDFPQALDARSELSRELAITSMPSTVCVSASGEILDTHAGELNADQLTELLERHFGLTPAPA